jgi:hypothetical protein
VSDGVKDAARREIKYFIVKPPRDTGQREETSS